MTQFQEDPKSAIWLGDDWCEVIYPAIIHIGLGHGQREEIQLLWVSKQKRVCSLKNSSFPFSVLLILSHRCDILDIIQKWLHILSIWMSDEWPWILLLSVVFHLNLFISSILQRENLLPSEVMLITTYLCVCMTFPLVFVISKSSSIAI